VTAFALATPGLKSEGPPQETLLLRSAPRWSGDGGLVQPGQKRPVPEQSQLGL